MADDVDGRKCRECGARCCRYVAIEIDEPTAKREYDHVRWYLLHEGVSVFIDHDGDWFVEYAADCSRLGPDLLCRDYDERPRICRKYGEGDEVCEYDSDDPPHRRRFEEMHEFETYLDDRGINWRPKKKKRKKGAASKK